MPGPRVASRRRGYRTDAMSYAVYPYEVDLRLKQLESVKATLQKVNDYTTNWT